MFDILEPFLKKAGLRYVKCELFLHGPQSRSSPLRTLTDGLPIPPPDIGSMPNDKREEALSKIKNDPNCTVILISLSAGLWFPMSSNEPCSPIFNFNTLYRVWQCGTESDSLLQSHHAGPLVECVSRREALAPDCRADADGFNELDPAIEDQAIDRAHRLGVRPVLCMVFRSPVAHRRHHEQQKEDVKVYKITIQGTCPFKNPSSCSDMLCLDKGS